MIENLTREELVAALRSERARNSDLEIRLQQEQRARQEEQAARDQLQRALDLLIEQRVYDCWLAERRWLQRRFNSCGQQACALQLDR